jgi:hypothetical protein
MFKPVCHWSTELKVVTVKVHNMLPSPLLSRMVQFGDNSCPTGFEPYTARHIEIKVPHSFPSCQDIPLQRRFLHGFF